ncbi:hypothetical protein PtA15_1A637 [Puccinia triticina]|uniref:Uncharacterized protein n=1 Tax=Puccinia triticina TaxID=208348 RepID=A0ABY7CEN9_9BASI|nr:uncharacterized protein PtA15_1A637 [Puccinia triticina]WAQ81297.1 hypothetical protein PtA15_1A637 [Puccinia triticina]
MSQMYSTTRSWKVPGKCSVSCPDGYTREKVAGGLKQVQELDPGTSSKRIMPSRAAKICPLPQLPLFLHHSLTLPTSSFSCIDWTRHSQDDSRLGEEKNARKDRGCSPITLQASRF